MREETFPFSHFRDYGNPPVEKPNISIDSLQSIGDEFTKKKLIVVDDLTGSYRFRPVNRFGVLSYVGFYNYIDEMRRQEARPKTKAIDVLIGHDDKNRQVIDVATSLQSALGHFVFHTLRRMRALDITIDGFSSDYFIRDKDSSIHTAEAIAELGHCMLYPHTGTMPSPRSENAKYTLDLAQSISDFGSYAALTDIDSLATADGYALMNFARNEQKRRFDQYKPRFDLTLNEFGYLQSDFKFEDELEDSQLFAVRFE